MAQRNKRARCDSISTCRVSRNNECLQNPAESEERKCFNGNKVLLTLGSQVPLVKLPCARYSVKLRKEIKYLVILHLISLFGHLESLRRLMAELKAERKPVYIIRNRYSFEKDLNPQTSCLVALLTMTSYL